MSTALFAAAFTLAVSVGAATGNVATPIDEHPSCAAGETLIMSVADDAEVAESINTMPDWRTTIDPGGTLCAGEYSDMYQVWEVTLADGRDGVTSPAGWVELPPLPEGGFSYSGAERSLTSGELHALPTYEQASDIGAGTAVHVEDGYSVDGPANAWGRTEAFVPVRAEDGTTGWALADDLADLDTAPDATPSAAPAEPAASPRPTSTAAAAPPTSHDDADAWDWLGDVPTTGWVTLSVAALMVGMSFILFRRRRRSDDESEDL